MYIASGINHFINPSFYLAILPQYLPWHLQLVNASGFVEIGLGVLILFKKYRRLAAWLIIAMLIAFIPVHLQMLLDYSRKNSLLLWIAIIRLPLQLLLIWWAYSFAKKNIIKRKKLKM